MRLVVPVPTATKKKTERRPRGPSARWSGAHGRGQSRAWVSRGFLFKGWIGGDAGARTCRVAVAVAQTGTLGWLCRLNALLSGRRIRPSCFPAPLHCIGPRPFHFGCAALALWLPTCHVRRRRASSKTTNEYLGPQRCVHLRFCREASALNVFRVQVYRGPSLKRALWWSFTAWLCTDFLSRHACSEPLSRTGEGRFGPPNFRIGIFTTLSCVREFPNTLLFAVPRGFVEKGREKITIQVLWNRLEASRFYAFAVEVLGF